MSNKKYNYDDLTDIVRQIENIKKKSLLIEIRDIIFNSNPKLNYTENSKGIYFHFHNLNPETYIKIEKFLKKNKNLLEEESTENYFDTRTNREEDNDVNFLSGFSNREKNLIKRRLYDTAISKNSEVTELKKNEILNNNFTDSSGENSPPKKSVFIRKNKI